DGNARALAREGGGNALAEARCRAGDECNLVVETHATSFLGRSMTGPTSLTTPRTRCAPSPRWGQGWGEGGEAYPESLTTHRTHLPMGEGPDRALRPALKLQANVTRV